MFSSCMEGIDKKRLLITVGVISVFIFASDFVIHGLILGESYKETSHLWRPENEMQSKMHIMLLGQFLIGTFFSIIFAKGYRGKGWIEGFRFGMLMGFFSMGSNCIWYTVMPLTCKIITTWIVGGFLQSLFGGLLAYFFYGRGRSNLG